MHETALQIMAMIRRAEISDHHIKKVIDESIMNYLGQIPKPVTKFSISVDAVIEITPRGYRPCFIKSEFSEKQNRVLWVVEYFDYNEDATFYQTQSYPICSEPLARLYSVIQCIEHARGKESTQNIANS